MLYIHPLKEMFRLTESFCIHMRKTILEFRLPPYEEISDVGLYLEQTARYVHSILHPLVDSTTLTASMISNYVKSHLLPGPVHKRYSRDQIAVLIFITIAKSIMSLEEIRIFLDLYEVNTNPDRLYTLFCEEFRSALLFSLDPHVLPPRTPENDPSAFLLHSAAVTIAHRIVMNFCFHRLQKK